MVPDHSAPTRARRGKHRPVLIASVGNEETPVKIRKSIAALSIGLAVSGSAFAATEIQFWHAMTGALGPGRLVTAIPAALASRTRR